MDMKITGAYNQYVAPPVKGQQFHLNPASPSRSGGDKISFSSQAEDFKTAMRAMQVTPDVRHDLVNNLREMIVSGTYNISAHDVASRIFHGLEG